MTPTAAARQWLDADRALAEVAHHERLRSDAAKVLKEHMRDRALQRFRGIGYASVTYESLDTAKARELLGPTKTSAATVTRTRETLSDLKRTPKAAASAAA